MRDNDIPDVDRTKNLLMNWRHWAQDCDPDPAEGTMCPMFASILPKASVHPYDEESALLVEEVLRIMHPAYQREWWILCAYYGVGMLQEEIADRLGINQPSVSKYRLPMARRIFAEQWAGLIRRLSPFD
jgi:hypothetical protein